MDILSNLPILKSADSKALTNLPDKKSEDDGKEVSIWVETKEAVADFCTDTFDDVKNVLKTSFENGLEKAKEKAPDFIAKGIDEIEKKLLPDEKEKEAKEKNSNLISKGIDKIKDFLFAKAVHSVSTLAKNTFAGKEED